MILRSGGSILEQRIHEGIAIIGMASRYPNADNLSDFWKVISGGIDCVSDCPDERKKDIDEYLDNIGQDKNQRKYRKAAYLKEIDKFDYEFFRIPPKEAGLMDPHQRLFLETAFHAVEDSGYSNRLSNTKTGIYVGFPTEFSAKVYQNIIFETNPELSGDSFTGNLPAVLPARLSYHLNLRGPSLLVDTSCSSSLVAIHLACQSLLQGDCDYALAGGVNLFVVPTLNAAVEGIGIVSSDGKTKSFDEHCDGVGQGEGVGVVVLKPLSKALEDRDNIYAVIKGSAINQDGKSIGITAPNAVAQEEVIIEAWERAGIQPETITFLEAHGTATKLGDPTEVMGIRKAFRRFSDKIQFCAIGSVKTNIGHTIGAAGVAGVIKSALALQKRQIPPNVHFRMPNRKINFEESPLYVSNQLQLWNNDYPRRCGISSFGISGTNCHIVLEEAPEWREKSDTEGHIHFFTLSASSKERLYTIINVYRKFLQDNQSIDIRSLCYTVNTTKITYNYRFATVISSVEDLISVLNESYLNECLEEINGPKVWIQFTDRKCDDGNSVFHPKLYDMQTASQTCHAFVSGQIVDWTTTYSKVRKISLPGYPFKKNRCWIKMLPNQKPRNVTEIISHRYFETAWEEKIVISPNKDLTQKSIAIFSDGTLIGSTVIDELRKDGLIVYEIRSGASFERKGDYLYQTANNTESYVELLKELSKHEIMSFTFLPGLSRNKSVETIMELRRELAQGVYALFHLTKALHTYPILPVKLIIATRTANEVIPSDAAIPENNAIFGFAKALQWECPTIKCKCVDLGQGSVIQDLLNEIKNEDYSEFVCAFRDGKRYIESVQTAELQKFKDSNTSIKEGGTYLITGGTGRIGLRLASHMANYKNTRIILLSRSKFPDRAEWETLVSEGGDPFLSEKIKMALEINRKGADLQFRRCDVSDEQSIQGTLDQIYSEYGQIDGIVHCAVSDENIRIQNMTDNHLHASFSSKIESTWLLNKLTEKKTLDFIVLCSSVMTLISGHANAIYTAGNSYLDAFPSYTKRKNIVTVNWPEWKGIGLDEDKSINEELSIFRKITETEALQIFDQVIGKNVPRLIVGEMNYNSQVFELLEYLPFNLSDDLKSRLEIGSVRTAKKTLVRVVTTPEQIQVSNNKVRLVGRETMKYTEVERKLASAWVTVLGYTEINIQDNFFEIGGSSISAVRISIELLDIGIVLEAPDILRYQTIEKIAEFLEREGGFNSGYN